ncbi:Ceramidase [Penicillium expansum]|nr:Ceramidase [Penicillium expansum]
MLFTTTPLLHRVLTVNANRKDSFVAGAVIYIALSLLIIYHVTTDELIVHASFFVSSITIIGIRTIQLLKQRTAENSTARRQFWGMVVFGAGKSIYQYLILLYGQPI